MRINAVFLYSPGESHRTQAVDGNGHGHESVARLQGFNRFLIQIAALDGLEGPVEFEAVIDRRVGGIPEPDDPAVAVGGRLQGGDHGDAQLEGQERFPGDRRRGRVGAYGRL